MADTDDQQKEGRKHFTVELERIGVAAAKVLVWAILSGTLVLYFWTKYSHRVGIASPAAYEYAQIARNNLRGEWFRTDVIRPLELWLDADVRNQPDLVHPPAYSVVLTGLMRITGVRDATILYGSGLFYFLTMPVLYFATRSMFNRRIARLSLFFYVIMPAIGIAAVSGTPAMLAVFLVTSFFALLSLVRPRRYLLTAAAAVVLAACALTATRYLFLVVPAVAFLVLTLRRYAWVHVPIFIVVVALGVLPWASRNARLTGSPWPPMEWTTSFRYADTSQTVERALTPEALGTAERGRDAARSLARNLQLGLGDLVRYGTQSLLIVFCIAGVLVRADKRTTEWIRIALYGAIAIELVYGAVARPDSFLLLPFVPLMIVVGTFTFLELTKRLGYSQPISRFAVIAASLVVAVLQLLSATNPADAATPADRERYATCRVLQALREAPEPEAIVLSNVPWHTAWYLDRPSIWLPPDYDDLARLRMLTGEKATFAFLAGYALDPDAPSYEIWKEGVERGGMPDSFGLGYFAPPVRPQRRIFSAYISPERFQQLLERGRASGAAPEPSTADERSNKQEPPADSGGD